MEELFQQLVENEILTPETKDQLVEAFKQHIEESSKAKLVEMKAEAEANVRVELQEQYQADKEALIEALDTKLEEGLKGELDSLKDDIENFRDLEVEYAEKLAEAKEEYQETLKGDIEELVEAVDGFLDMRIAEEINELKEDIDTVKRLQFGSEIYEAFESIYNKKFVNENAVEVEMQDKEEKLSELTAKLEESSKELEKVRRERKLDEVLSTLHGRSREVMEAVLKNSPTDKLEEAYEYYIVKVLHESSETEAVVESEKEKDEDNSSVLAEGDDADTKSDDKVTAHDDTVVLEGNSDENEQIEESVNEDVDTVPDYIKEEIARFKRLTSS